jgi:hypothetical protein
MLSFKMTLWCPTALHAILGWWCFGKSSNFLAAQVGSLLVAPSVALV